MQRVPVSVLVATKNEVRNIRKCLRAVEWADEVVVVDSGSTDGTVDAVRALGREVVQFVYSGAYPKKRQWAINHLPLRNDWILLLDADEEVTGALAREIADVVKGADHADLAGYFVLKGFHFLGRRLKFGAFSHSALLLIRRGRATFERLEAPDDSGFDMEIHERLTVEGATGRLRNSLVHRDFKNLQAYIDRHNRYSTWEAQFRTELMTRSTSAGGVRASPWGNLQERRRFLKTVVMRLPFEPWLWFCYHYLFRLGFLDGRRGLIAAQIRRAYIEQVRAKMYEHALPRNSND